MAKFSVTRDEIQRVVDSVVAKVSSSPTIDDVIAAVFAIIAKTKVGKRAKAAPESWQALTVALAAHFVEGATMAPLTPTSFAAFPQSERRGRPLSDMMMALPVMVRTAFDTLPHLVGLDLTADHAGKSGGACVRTLTKRQAFGVMAASFLCLFDRASMDCMSDTEFPSINLDEMHATAFRQGYHCLEVGKIRMHLDYLVEMAARVVAQDPRLDDLAHSLVIVRTKAAPADRILATMPDTPLTACELHPLGESIDEQHNMLRADFANAVIGGASLSFGCVQEEIMFTICPEMNISRLFCTPMEPDEAILIFRAERFASVKQGTYGLSLDYGGKFADSHATSCAVAAIDAMDFRSMSKLAQYTRDGVARELVKAIAGFGFSTSILPESISVPSDVATGNWGCGVFGGNSEVKLLEQWVACSYAGRAMHYFPFNDKGLAQNFPPLHQRIVELGITTKWLADYLMERLCEVVVARKTPFEMLHAELDHLAADRDKRS